MNALYGSTALAINVTTGSVTFPITLSDYPTILLTVENILDGVPTTVGTPIVTSITEPVTGQYTGFTYALNNTTDTENFTLNYSVNADAITPQVTPGPGRRVDRIPQHKAGLSMRDKLSVIPASGSSRLKLVEIGRLRSLFAGIMQAIPTDVNSSARENELRVIEQDGQYYLAVGVGANAVGRVALNTTNWNTPTTASSRQKFQFPLGSGESTHEFTFATPFAGAPSEPPVVVYSFRYTGVGDPDVISSTLTEVTNELFRLKTGAISSADYIIEGEAFQ